jgi:hypothetical protein
MANFKFVSKKKIKKNLEDDFKMNCDIKDDLNDMERVNNKRKLDTKVKFKYKIYVYKYVNNYQNNIYSSDT